MTNKVQLIKEEIERKLKDIVGAYESEDTEHGYKQCCKEILNFINSLPEESGCEVNFTTKSEDLEEEMIRWHKEHFGNKRDWEKTSGEYLTRKSQLDIAHHFAEWQKQQMKETLQTEYEKGRFDMQQEMMKDAISCNVDWYDGFRLDYTQERQDDILLKLGADVGDKVKIIIIKEEQQ